MKTAAAAVRWTARLDQLRQRFGPRAVLRGRPVSVEQKDFRRDDLDSVTGE